MLLSLVFSVLCLESKCVLQPNECLAVPSSCANERPLQLASTHVGMLLTGLKLLLPTPSLATVGPGSQKCQGKEVSSERMVCLCGSERRLVLCEGGGLQRRAGSVSPLGSWAACVCSYTVLQTSGWTLVPVAPDLPLVHGCTEGHGAEPRACGYVILGRTWGRARHAAAPAFGVLVVGPCQHRQDVMASASALPVSSSQPLAQGAWPVAELPLL